jgi:hypothetical protein
MLLCAIRAPPQEPTRLAGWQRHRVRLHLPHALAGKAALPAWNDLRVADIIGDLAAEGVKHRLGRPSYRLPLCKVPCAFEGWVSVGRYSRLGQGAAKTLAVLDVV